jgi:hypothetical protein
MRMRTMAPLGRDERPEDRIRKKHQGYADASLFYKFLYYATRLAAGLCAAILPFVVYSAPPVATGLSIAIAVITVFDAVFDPKDQWKRNSRTSDLLYVADLKKQGRYDEFKETLDIILTAEDQEMIQLIGMDEVIRRAKTGPEGQTPGPKA